jgi:hypothetical protein
MTPHEAQGRYGDYRKGWLAGVRNDRAPFDAMYRDEYQRGLEDGKKAYSEAMVKEHERLLVIVNNL